MRRIDEWNWNLYDPEEVDGYPVNLQIIGRKLEEERVLGAATVIEKVWKSFKCENGNGTK